MASRYFLCAVIVALAACGNETASPDPVNLRTITLPGGHRIHAEVMMRRDDMMRGMMFRAGLNGERGLLFVHRQPGKYTYWMFNVRVPLDIIWMDKEHRIIEISRATPPCEEKDPVKCPQYGGAGDAQFVLELAAGMADKHNLAPGQQLDF